MEIARAIAQHVPERDARQAVSAKFLDTFMHQLMKYEQCRPLWPVLHLPLDSRVFAALRRLKPSSLSEVQDLFSASPYSRRYEKHLNIQRALLRLIREFNDRPNAEFKIHSRVELNCLLWIEESR
jgi:hypothetical protein